MLIALGVSKMPSKPPEPEFRIRPSNIQGDTSSLDHELRQLILNKCTDDEFTKVLHALTTQFDLTYENIESRSIEIALLLLKEQTDKEQAELDHKQAQGITAAETLPPAAAPPAPDVNLADIPETVLEPYAVNIDGVHKTIQGIPRWVVWDPLELHTEGENKGKPTKRPLQTNGDPASTTDASTWCTFQEVIAATQYRPGLVLNNYSVSREERLTGASGRVGIDADHCILPNGQVTEWGQRVLAMATKVGALIETSVSGTGFHILCRGKAIKTGKKNIDPALQEQGPNSKEKIEIYDHTSPRYFTITGQVLGNGDPDAAGEELIDFIFDQFFADDELADHCKSFKFNGSAIERTPVELIDLEEIKTLLAGTPADDNPEWIWMGYALKGAAMAARENQEFWDQKFFEIWDTWSAKSEKYIPEVDLNGLRIQSECARRWKRSDFLNSRSGISTVYRIAEKYGNKRKRKKIKIGKLERVSPMSNTDNGANKNQDRIPQEKSDSTGSGQKEPESGLNPEDLIDNSQLGIARNTIKVFGKDNLIYAQSDFYRWTNQLWTKANDLEIKKQITHICEITNANQTDAYYKEVTSDRVNSILNHIKTEAFRPSVVFDRASNCINVQNGELHFNGKDWELQPHRRESYRLSLIPVVYDPKAKAPRFIKFLNGIFKGDDDHEDKKKCIRQFMGYSLTTNCKYEKFLLLIGVGENGKGVLLYVVDNLVGSHNASAIDPSNFDKEFNLAHLQGKYVNLVPEIAEGAEIDDAAFKSITSGDKKQAAHKYKDLFDYYPYAKLWLGTQYLPHTRDVSHAFFRRPLVIYFNHIFRKANDPDRKPEDPLADVDLKPKLVSELPGILNLALNGLVSLWKQGGFTEPASSYAARASWRLGVDQVAQFVDERCKTGEGMVIDFKTLYQHYQNWATEAGITKKFARKKFGQRLDAMGFKGDRGSGGTYLRKGIEIDFNKNN